MYKISCASIVDEVLFYTLSTSNTYIQIKVNYTSSGISVAQTASTSYYEFSTPQWQESDNGYIMFKNDSIDNCIYYAYESSNKGIDNILINKTDSGNVLISTSEKPTKTIYVTILPFSLWYYDNIRYQ